jgi:hypothetical protein
MFRHLKGPMDIHVVMKALADVIKSGLNLAVAGTRRRKRNDVDC